MFLTEEEIKASERRRQDFRDLLAEMAGSNVQLPRFLKQADIDRIRAERYEPVAADTLVMTLWLQSQAMARRLQDINDAIDRALDRARENERNAGERLKAIQACADKMADGTLAYRTRDHQHAFTDDGIELTEAQMNAVHWTDTAPTWEERQAAGQALNDAIRAREEIERYRDRADYYTTRNGAEDLTERELQEMEADLNAMPQSVRKELHDIRSAPPIPPRQDTPDLFADFDLAASELDEIRNNVPQPTRTAGKPPQP